jgi:hypothetical protein
MQRAVIWVALPVIVYLVVALIMTWPLVTQLNSHIAGASYGDSYMMLRQAWAARESVLDGRSPLHQDLLAYPNGFTSRLMWSTPLRWVPVMVLSFVVSPLMAFNVWMIITVILNGLTAYWLGMELGGRQVPAALLGGLVFTAFPNMQGHLAVGHIDVLAMYGLPLVALCAWRVLRADAGWPTVIGGGVWLALACLGLTSQIVYNVMPVMLFLGLYHLLWGREWLVRRERPLLDQPWLKFGAIAALGGAILLIFFGPLMTDAGRREIAALHETGRVTFSADVLAFVSPSLFGPLEKWGLVPDYARDVLGTNSTEGAAYLGIAALALVVIGVITRREARPWLLVALGAMVFSLGPLLKWRDQPVTIHFEQFKSYVTLPWVALQDLPVLEATRTPGRFNGATALAWGALVSIGAGAVFGRLAPRSPLDDFERIFARRGRGSEGRGVWQYAPTETWGIVQAGIALVAGIVILIEYQLFWPYATLDAAQPGYFHELSKENDVRAVLNVPVGNSVTQMVGMFQQTIHGKPMIAGQLYRRSPQDPALLAVLDRATTGIEAGWMPPMRNKDVHYMLSQVGADRVIVNRLQLPDAGDVVKRLKTILGPPEYKDPIFEVYAVPRADEPPANAGLIFAASADGWSDAIEAFGGAFLADSGEWYFYAPREMSGELVFRTQPYAIPRQVGAWLDGHLITAWWAEDGQMRLPLWFGAGFHTLRFEALDGCDPYPFTLTCLAGDCAPVETPTCISVAFGTPEWVESERALTPLDVRLDYGLRLRAYDLAVDEAARTVFIRLFWENDKALPRALKGYALFAHVADPETAEPLAQYDGFPLIPMDQWGRAWWVSDVTITLPDDLPAGEYAVNVGWFKPETNERIAVLGDRPWAGAGLVYLETVAVP